MNFFIPTFDQPNHSLFNRVYHALFLILKLEFPVKSNKDLNSALKIIDSNHPLHLRSTQLITTSMSANDFPLVNAVDALQKFYIVIGEIKKIPFQEEEQFIADTISNKSLMCQRLRKILQNHYQFSDN